MPGGGANVRGRIGRAVAATVAALLPPVASAVAAEKAEVAFEVGMPDGFGDLDGPEKAVVDVFFRGRLLGQAEVTISGAIVTFERPAAVAAMLPRAGGGEALLLQLSRPFAAHDELVCGEGADPARCGRLAPAELGVVLDRRRFRLDLFAGPEIERQLSEAAPRYISQPNSAFSVVDTISGFVTGSNRGAARLDVQNSVIAASGSTRFRADLFHSSARGLQADQALVETEMRDLRYSAGLMFAPGTDLVIRRKLLGVGFTSQLDTRAGRELLLSNPLAVSLAGRARVEIVRHGRVLSSQVLDPGNRQLDTGMLPEGAYDVVLRISELGAPVREERRYFAKSSRVAPLGSDLFYGYAGVTARENARKIVSVTKEPYAAAGWAHRWTTGLASDASMIASGNAAVAQLGGNLFVGKVQLRAAALLSTTGARGGLVELSASSEHLSASFDLRRIRLGGAGSLDGILNEPATRPSSLPDPVSALRGGATSFTQLTSFLGLSARNGQFGVSVSMRKQPAGRLAYGVGPSARIDLVRSGPLRLSLDSDAALTERGRSGFLGVSLSFAGLRSSSGSRAGLRYAHVEGEEKRWHPVASVQGGIQQDGFAGGFLELGGGFDQAPEGRQANVNARLRTSQFAAMADLVRGGGGDAEYSAGLQSTVAIAGGRLALGNPEREKSALLVEFDGGRPGDRFEVLVDEAVVATVDAGQVRTIMLAPYREYAVRARSISSGAVGLDQRTRTVALYPGTVTRIEWAPRPMATMVGRLTSPAGDPERMAFLASADNVAETNDDGFFQIEAAPGATITARRADGSTCTALLPETSVEAGFTMVGNVVCRADPPTGAVIAARNY